MCLADSNEPVERVSSLMNGMRTAEKTGFRVATLTTMLMLKVNLTMKCKRYFQYFEYICIKGGMLKNIHSSRKD